MYVCASEFLPGIVLKFHPLPYKRTVLNVEPCFMKYFMPAMRKNSFSPPHHHHQVFPPIFFLYYVAFPAYLFKEEPWVARPAQQWWPLQAVFKDALQSRAESATYRNKVKSQHDFLHHNISGLIIGLRPANERCRYKVTPSLIGWTQT